MSGASGSIVARTRDVGPRTSIMLHSTRLTITEEANRVLHSFYSRLTFLWKGNLLCLQYLPREGPRRVVVAQVSQDSGALCINYGRLGMAGIGAMAVGQLARWIRGQTRVPLSAWRYWASDKIRLAGDRGTIMLHYIENSSYDDGTKTRCVLCGENRCGDWWHLDGLTGPCCTYARCQRS